MNELAEKISQWIKNKVDALGKSGALFGLSGGLDSTIVAVLTKKALGEKCLALVMPCRSNANDERDALEIAQTFDIKTERVDLALPFNELLKLLPSGNKLAVGNMKPRLRMITAYYYANCLNYLVVGTGNKSEIETGYFTKYGDGGVDILPLGGLYKTQLRKLAKELGIPERIIKKPPSAGLWEGQTDEKELAIKYEELDKALIALSEGKTDALLPEIAEKIKKRKAASLHKVTPISYFDPSSNHSHED